MKALLLLTALFTLQGCAGILAQGREVYYPGYFYCYQPYDGSTPNLRAIELDKASCVASTRGPRQEWACMETRGYAIKHCDDKTGQVLN